MRIGIIGTGNVGTALARGFVGAGHDVVLGSRTPDSPPNGLGAVGDEVAVEPQGQAAEDGEVVVLAVPGGAAPVVAADLAGHLRAKPVIDATNEYPEATAERSLAARVADAAPDARVVKAFNTIGAERMTAPEIDGERATMFVAGDDRSARETVTTLAADLGFDPLVAGDLGAATHLEHLARLWIHLSADRGRDIGFRLLRE
ncbi:NAD(P)-binding domain-containing protein [Halomicroarcula limicola]|uniref:NAD(P)-binding domain-containing protein n=1 Tax=Haloarcula limicola TaxID=1429915 RepID=A0A8J7YE85_9EURY|nr:NAD(P)-binding domain-containing protein [Halomicroarcula limicola]MBV0924893.1 NAD(P)-binding domain-containing protein [Halomicroarcula limicola]